MPKLTVLKYIQKTLSEMDSDDVNNISETEESLQVAELLEDIFFDLMATRNWPHLRKVKQLEALADTLKPNYLRMPVGTKEIERIAYNIRDASDTRDRVVKIDYVEPEEFLLTHVNPRKSDADNIQVVSDFSGVKLNIFDDREPTIWTTFDDLHIVFDAFDKAVESTLQQSKSQVILFEEPSFTIADSFVPDIPSEMVPLLLNELKSRASFSLAQKQNVKAEGEAVRQRRVMSRKDFKARGGIRFRDFSRKTRKAASQRRNPLFDKT